MRTAIGAVLMFGALMTGVPGVLLMRCARWCGNKLKEVDA